MTELIELIRVNFGILNDRLNDIEEKLIEVLKSKKSKSDMALYDNPDLMEITQLSYRKLQYYRANKELIPLNKKGKNFYTQEEVHRFLTEVLNEPS